MKEYLPETGHRYCVWHNSRCRHVLLRPSGLCACGNVADNLDFVHCRDFAATMNDTTYLVATATALFRSPSTTLRTGFDRLRQGRRNCLFRLFRRLCRQNTRSVFPCCRSLPRAQSNGSKTPLVACATMPTAQVVYNEKRQVPGLLVGSGGAGTQITLLFRAGPSSQPGATRPR
jgi:hypothetical protein